MPAGGRLVSRENTCDPHSQDNAERVAEEKTGHVRWLLPEYQIPRFGSEAEHAALKAAKDDKRKASQAALDLDDDLQEMKPKFPTGDELAETAAIMRALAFAPGALSIDDIAATFKGGLQNKRRVALSILALARLGHISSTDGGATFALRRSA